MNASSRSLVIVLALAAASLSGAVSACAQMVIASLPYTITTKGTYILNGDLNSSLTSGNLITVSANNVPIDLQGHYISGPAGNTGQSTYEIYAYEMSNITVKNGTVANCNVGIYISGNNTATTNSVNHQVDSVRATYCNYVGIWIPYGPGTRITNCQVSQSGYSGAAFAYGIAIDGAGATVQNNVVSTVTATNQSFGIYSQTGSFTRQNTVSNCLFGVYGGKYQDNLTANCTTAYTNGTDAGGNN